MRRNLVAFGSVVVMILAVTAWSGLTVRHAVHGSKFFELPGHCDLTSIPLNAADSKQDGASIYEPKPEDYRDAYDSDKANSVKQTRSEYYAWVETFYRGNLFAKGWNPEARRLISKVNDDKAREEITRKVNGLGRKISQEWSKDNSLRKIDTNDVTAFGRQLDQAIKTDNGSGSTIRATLEKIDKVVTDRLGKKGPPSK